VFELVLALRQPVEDVTHKYEVRAFLCGIWWRPKTQVVRKTLKSVGQPAYYSSSLDDHSPVSQGISVG
jgi:hypothetical protein